MAAMRPEMPRGPWTDGQIDRWIRRHAVCHRRGAAGSLLLRTSPVARQRPLRNRTRAHEALGRRAGPCLEDRRLHPQQLPRRPLLHQHGTRPHRTALRAWRKLPLSPSSL